ncbi:MAG: FHA domain-containing protein [Anaerolineae bacterium]|nr:FHA domain-containing protein [Anaerolineae bacterium]
MSTPLVFFILRIVSALALLVFLGALFWVMWRDFATASEEIDANRRVHGRLVHLQQIDGRYVATPETFPLLSLTSLGRGPSNVVPVEDSFASTDHAVIALRGGRWWLEDRQSTNGTSLNGIVIDQPVIVTDGDIVSIGQSHYRLELE